MNRITPFAQVVLTFSLALPQSFAMESRRDLPRPASSRTIFEDQTLILRPASDPHLSPNVFVSAHASRLLRTSQDRRHFLETALLGTFGMVVSACIKEEPKQDSPSVPEKKLPEEKPPEKRNFPPAPKPAPPPFRTNEGLRTALHDLMARHNLRGKIARLALLPGWTKDQWNDATDRFESYIDNAVLERDNPREGPQIMGVNPIDEYMIVNPAYWDIIARNAAIVLCHEITHLAARQIARHRQRMDLMESAPKDQAGESIYPIDLAKEIFLLGWSMELEPIYYEAAMLPLVAAEIPMSVGEFIATQNKRRADALGLTVIEYAMQTVLGIGRVAGQPDLDMTDFFLNRLTRHSGGYVAGRLTDYQAKLAFISANLKPYLHKILLQMARRTYSSSLTSVQLDELVEGEDHFRFNDKRHANFYAWAMRQFGDPVKLTSLQPDRPIMPQSLPRPLAAAS